MTDPRRLDLLRRWARIFDSAFRIPGTNIRFGIDPILGLVPGVGDLATPMLSLVMLWHAARLHVPKIVLARMVFNALIDAIMGVVPVAGDLFDFGWKATQWNLALIERHAVHGARPTSGDYLFVTLCSIVLIAVALIPILVLIALGSWVEQLLRPLF